MKTMLLFIPVVVATLCVGIVHSGCNTPSDAAAPDASSWSETSIEDQLSKDPIDPGDRVPVCQRNCTGKSCGTSDGCGGKCLRGACPSGLTCGGGGTPGVCACQPSCAGKSCGEPDGCGGACNAGACPAGQGCSIVTPGQCAAIPIGQGVECFVFGDGYTSMAGPSGAIYFASDGQACIPDGTSTGTCRKWWGRCQTTDASHTPVVFRGGDVPWFANGVTWSGTSDAIFSRHFQNLFSPPESAACLPNGTSAGDCHQYFGNAQTPDGRAVRCHLFDDGGSAMTASTDRMYDAANKTVWGAGLGGAKRKWFGDCSVGGCGDGICDPNESVTTCSDCTCGNGVCDGTETASSCAQDCVRCGDGVCNGGENANSCAQDCVRCGDGVCNGGETCGSCSADCSCPKTCSGAAASSSAQLFAVYWENAQGCAGYSLPFANDLAEAQSCVGPYVTVEKTPPADYWFHLQEPGYACHDIKVASYSTDDARNCAQLTTGYAFELEGPCP